MLLLNLLKVGAPYSKHGDEVIYKEAVRMKEEQAQISTDKHRKKLSKGKYGSL